jgi:hypothetical protein
MEQDLASLAQHGEHKNIPGIGKDLSEIIESKSARATALEDLTRDQVQAPACLWVPESR